MPRFMRLILVSASPEEVAEAAAGHRLQLAELKRLGKLRVAGELAGDDGFLEILEVEDRHEAERWTRDSPLVHQGLGSWLLREWSESEV